MSEAETSSAPSSSAAQASTAQPSAALRRVLLLVVDLQPVFLGAVRDGAAVLQRASFAIEAARGLGLPIAFTEQVPEKLGGTAPELRTLAGEAPAFAKESFSAWNAPGLREWMEERSIEHVLLAGIETPVCIYQTAIAALAEERQVTLLSDCLGARRADDAATVLGHLARLGCHPLPSETVFYSILESTRHPYFREFTKLVKRHGSPV